jgi:hypothetical protein
MKAFDKEFVTLSRGGRRLITQNASADQAHVALIVLSPDWKIGCGQVPHFTGCHAIQLPVTLG